MVHSGEAAPWHVAWALALVALEGGAAHKLNSGRGWCYVVILVACGLERGTCICTWGVAITPKVGQVKTQCGSTRFTCSTSPVVSDYPAQMKIRYPHLDEANGGGLFAEALTAEVKAVLADETSLVGAEAAGIGA